MIGTRKQGLNTKIEPLHKGSKKLNVVKVTIPEPFDKNIVSDKTAEQMAGMSVYAELVRIMKEATKEYYNMRIALGLECA